jgi:hypothetical protein
MCKVIQGILTAADESLSWEEINKIVYECIQTLAWEGRRLGKIELISDGQLVHIITYDNLSDTAVPAMPIGGGLMLCRH